MKWFVYAIKSQKDARLYIGMSEDPKDRIKQHNFGMTKSTKAYRPYELVFVEECASRG